jgi:uncharacterized protein (DUF924 family)
MNFLDVLDFWFEQLTPEQHFIKNDALDLKMVERFIVIHSQAIAGELALWREFPKGRLAEIILIDQFSRNIYRDDPKAYANDTVALVLAQEAISKGIQKEFSVDYKQFLYMPFMHSESKVIHEKALILFSEPGLESSFPYEKDHKKIIDRFGRFPERNAILGRMNTPEENEYLLEQIDQDHRIKINIAENTIRH